MTIKTGIFWFVRGEMIADRYDYDTKDFSQKDFIDYPYSHFDRWDELSRNRFTYADFATYPRGRLLFDVKRGKYLLYLDHCITAQEIKQLVVFFELEKEPYELSYEEHYSCDKCFSNF